MTWMKFSTDSLDTGTMADIDDTVNNASSNTIEKSVVVNMDGQYYYFLSGSFTASDQSAIISAVESGHGAAYIDNEKPFFLN